jgi:hypothetical protein
MTPATRRDRRHTFGTTLGKTGLTALLLAAAGCITPDGYYRDLDAGAGGHGGTGGTTGSGGAAGGGASTGGTTGTGGTVTTGSGGTTASGGTTGKGGTTGTGGSVATGGTTGSGGSVATGGTTGSGGASSTGGAAGAGSTLFSDNFENGIATWFTNGLGTAMTATDGSTVYEINCPMSKVCLSANGNVNWTDVIVQARVKIVSFNGSSSSYYAAVCARVEDANNYYCVTLRSDGNVAIRGDIAGSSGTIGSSASYGVVTGTWYTVQLEVVGSTITASINGTPVLPKAGSSAITDASLTHGGIALAIDNGVVEFDDVVVTTP